MKATVADPRLDVQRKPAAASLRPDCNSLAPEWTKRRVGQVIERTLVLADMTKQEASYLMGYPDQSALSRWIAGTEPPQWHKLAAIGQLRLWIPVAWAEQTGADVRVTVDVRRTA